MAETLGSAVLELRTDASKFTSGIKGAQTQAGGLSKTFSKLSKFKLPALAVAGAIAALGVMAKKAIDAADVMDKLAKKTGFSVEALGALKLQAELGGTNLGTMEKAVKRMQASLVDASLGMQSAVDGLDMIGVSIDDLKGKTPEEQFFLLTKALQGIEDPTLKAAAAQKIFGRAGVELIPTLDNLSKGMDFVLEEVEKLGPVLTTEGAAAAAGFNDALTNLGTALGTAGAAFLNSGVIQFFTDVVNGITDVIGSFGTIRESLGGLGIDWDAIWGRISTSAETRLTAITGLISSFLAFFVTAWETDFGKIKTVAEIVWGLILSIIDGAMVAIDAVFSGTLGAIAGIFDIFTAALTGNWSALWDGIKTVFSGVWEAMLGIIDGAIIAISGALASFFSALGATEIAGFFADVETSIKDARKETEDFDEAADDAIKPVKSLAKALADADKKAGSKGFGGAMKDAKKEVDRFDLSKAIKAAEDLANQVRDLTVEAIQKLIDVPLPDLTAGIKAMGEKASTATGKLISLVGGVKDLKTPMRDAGVFAADLEAAYKSLGIQSKDLEEKELADLGAAVNTVRVAMENGQAGAEDLQAAQEAYADALDAADGVTSRTDDFTTAIGNTLDKLKDLGSNIGDALVSGQPLDALKTMFTDLKSIAADFANIALQAVKDQLLGLIGLDLDGLANRMAGIFSSGGGGAPPIPTGGGGGGGGGAPGAPSGGGGFSGAAGKLAGAGDVAAIVTAISSVVQNFQMRRLNKVTDLIEKSTRFSLEILGGGSRADQGILGVLFGIRDKVLADIFGQFLFLNPSLDTIKGHTGAMALEINNAGLGFINPSLDTIKGSLFNIDSSTSGIVGAIKSLKTEIENRPIEVTVNVKATPPRSRSSTVEDLKADIKLNTGGIRTVIAKIPPRAR